MIGKLNELDPFEPVKFIDGQTKYYNNENCIESKDEMEPGEYLALIDI
jgi:hypothetical protein